MIDIDISRIVQATKSLADANAKAEETQKQVDQARADLVKGIGAILSLEVQSAIFASYEAAGDQVTKYFLIHLPMSNDPWETVSGSMGVNISQTIDYLDDQAKAMSPGQFFDYMGATTVEGVKKLAERILEATLNLLEERTKIVAKTDNPFG